MCDRFGVSTSGFYDWEKRDINSKKYQADQQLLKWIRKVHTGRRKAYGSPRIYRLLRRIGVVCSRRRVARIMRENGIKATVVGLYRSNVKNREYYQKIENKLADAQPATGINQQWAADFTYLKTRLGQWVYLAIVMDLYSRKIIGWSISKTRNTDMTKASLKSALRRRRPMRDTLFHTDQGTEYASELFQEALKSCGMIASMSGKGRCLDNATVESFFHTFKTESYYHRQFENLGEIEKEFQEFIDFYNNERLHSSLGYVSPSEFEKMAA